MNEKVLTICIPTYNRKEVLLDELMQYLSLKDDRFCIKVQDNCSTDGTIEELLKIEDERLMFKSNKKNIGSVPNWMLVLSNCSSKYILFVLDKDLINTNKLSEFITYLTEAKPCFGYIDLDITKTEDYIYTPAGYDNVRAMCYLDKHPSGYYYRTDIYNEAFNNSLFKKIEKSFIFPFEIMNGVIACKYPSTIVVKPIIINAAIREKKDTRTLSFDNSNIWFGEPKRYLEFSYYLDNAHHLYLGKSEIVKLSYYILEQGLNNVTIGLRNIYKNEDACYHYYVKSRVVTMREMIQNGIKLIKHYIRYTKKYLPMSTIYINVTKATLKILFMIIKGLI